MIVRAAAVAAALVMLACPVLAQTVSPPPAPPTIFDQAAPSAAAPSRATLPSFGSLFSDLAGDVRRLPSRETVMILGAAGGLSLAVRGQDAELTRRATASAALDSVFEAGEVGGGGAAQVGGAVAAFALGRVTRSPRLSALGADLIRGQIVNAAFTHAIKLSVNRTRPDGRNHSFPSGHTSSSFTTAAVLQRHFGWKAGIPAYGLAAYVAGSRLQENRHYMSDVLFGAAVGIVSGRTVTIGRHQSMFVAAPFGARGGGGIRFTWVGSQ